MAAATPAWLPLESNPDVLNPFLRKLGCPTDWSFCDVFGMDPELLMMRGAPLDSEAGLFFTQQLDGCGNACGTIACMHALGNAAAAAAGAFALDDGSLLGRFVAETAGSSAPDRGAALVAASYMHEASNATACAGATEGAGTEDHGNRHFICFVEHGGRLFELDGRTLDGAGRAFPVDHGPTTPESLVEDAAKVIRDDFMARDPESLDFNVVALCKGD
ncbi:thiol-dependent ubiquitin-specific protease [Aureococcus anophagefferens]|nr:thiol-dependent ubiquitin-specific protease [Aureococcus anophagefferens]